VGSPGPGGQVVQAGHGGRRVIPGEGDENSLNPLDLYAQLAGQVKLYTWVSPLCAYKDVYVSACLRPGVSG
jgi:hypothetical protein